MLTRFCLEGAFTMPLNLVNPGAEYTIQKILGKDKQRHHLESLVFCLVRRYIFSMFNNIM